MTTEPTKPRRRRWFSLSLRGLMLLILVVGGLMGWKARKASLQRRAVAKIEAMGGSVVYDWQYGGGAYFLKSNPSPPGPTWLRKALGDEYFQEVAQVNFWGRLRLAPKPPADADFDESRTKWFEATRDHEKKMAQLLGDDQLACLESFDQLQALVLMDRFDWKPEALARLTRASRLNELHIGMNLNDDLSRLGALSQIETLSIQLDFTKEPDLTFLDRMPRIKSLNIVGASTLDDQMAKIARLPKLETLIVFAKKLTDVGLAHLKDAKSIRFLCVSNARNLTGEGLAPLESLTNLESLTLSRMPMNRAGLDHLRKLPKLKSLDCSIGDLDDATIDQFKADRPAVSVTVSTIFGR